MRDRMIRVRRNEFWVSPASAAPCCCIGDVDCFLVLRLLRRDGTGGRAGPEPADGGRACPLVHRDAALLA